jgi:ABC-type uncharacterized transport system ATPase subunit
MEKKQFSWILIKLVKQAITVNPAIYKIRGHSFNANLRKMFSFCSYAPFASTPSFLNNVPAKVE